MDSENNEQNNTPLTTMPPLTANHVDLPTYTPDGKRVMHYTEVDFASCRATTPLVLMQGNNTFDDIAVALQQNGEPFSLSEIDAETMQAIDVTLEFVRSDGVAVQVACVGVNAENTQYPAKSVVYFHVNDSITACFGEFLAIVYVKVTDASLSGKLYGGYVKICIKRNPMIPVPVPPPPGSSYVSSFNGMTGAVEYDGVERETGSTFVYGNGANGDADTYPVLQQAGASTVKNHNLVSQAYFEEHQQPAAGMYAHHFQCLDNGGPSVYFVLFSSRTTPVNSWSDLCDMLHLNGFVQFREDTPAGPLVGTIFLDYDNVSIDYYGYLYATSGYTPEHMSGRWTSTTLAIFDDVVEAM